MAAQTSSSSSKPFPAQSLSLDDLGLIPQKSIAKLLDKTLRTVQRMTERGELPPTLSMARDQFYRKETILACLAQREREVVQRKQPTRGRRRSEASRRRRAS
jgi:hypothetical protein